MSAATGSSSRTRRGRRPAGEDTKALIEETARTEFAEKGYDATSLRGVARAAGVDPALVHHYFEGKADLFARSVVMSKVDPTILVDGLLAGPRESIGERLVRTFLSVWDEGDNQERLVAFIRAAMTNDDLATFMREFLVDKVVRRVTMHLGVDDPELRGGAAITQLSGLAISRYVLRVPAIVGASQDELVAWLGPTLQRYLVDGDVSPGQVSPR